MKMKILAIGDIHLGRSFPLVPHSLAEKKDFWIEAALNNILKFAEQECVDAVFFTGDIIENENDRFEALPVLSNFIKTLTNKNIATVAIVGNHDISALPRIQTLIPDLKILGRDKWESEIIKTADAESVNVVGLSHSHARNNELFRDFEESLCSKNLLNIGLLHCTLGNAPDKYFPVKKEELLSTNVDLWLLGHIHKPGDLNKESKYGYLGSVIGLDISETGSHGIQLIEIKNNFITRNEQIPIAPLRWETVEVDLTSCDKIETEEFKDQLIEKLLQEVNTKLEKLKAELLYTKLIGFRILLTGSLTAELNKEAVFCEFNNYHLSSYNNTEIFIEKLIDKTSPKLDIEKLSEQNDPVGLICQMFSKLKHDDNEKLIKELLGFIQKKATPKQKKYINEHLLTSDLQAIIVDKCKDNIVELWKQNRES
jgi:DNA repair protein SbcD/Mre11